MSKANRRHKKKTNSPNRPLGLFLSRQRKGRFSRLATRAVEKQSVAKKASAFYLLITCLVVAVVATAFVFHLHVRFEGVRLGYETSKIRAQRARLIVEQRELRLELASLKSPQRVESEAREKLGMEMPDHSRIISIGKKRRTVVVSGGAR